MLNRLKQDLKQAMLDRDEDRKDALRIVLGEIPRLNKKADEKVTDQEIETIIRKLIKSQIEIYKMRRGKDWEHFLKDDMYVNTLNEYIPKLMTEDEVKEWISANINLDDFNPKMKAMGIIMKSLKGKADGNVVKGVING